MHSVKIYCVFRPLTGFLGVQWWANRLDSNLPQCQIGQILWQVMWKHILLGKKSNSLPHLPIVLWETIPINIKSNSNCFMGRPTGLTERSLRPGKPSEPTWDGTLPDISLTVSQDPQKFFLLGSSRKGFCTPSGFPSCEEDEGNFWRPLHSCWWVRAGRAL